VEGGHQSDGTNGAGVKTVAGVKIVARAICVANNSWGEEDFLPKGETADGGKYGAQNIDGRFCKAKDILFWLDRDNFHTLPDLWGTAGCGW
jgi:hypothetical protein